MKPALVLLMSELQPYGQVLPNIVHFEPLPEFVDYIKSIEPRLVIDVGAGTGRMSSVLDRAGVACMAIDICSRDVLEWPVYMLDAITFNYPKDSLPIMARPCHGIWTDLAIEQALRTVDKMLYVGLKKNIEDDLGEIEGAKLVIEDGIFGADGELIVTITKA